MGKRSKKPRLLYTNGAGIVPGICYGMLRSSFSGRQHRAVDFVAAKLLTAVPAAAWAPRAERVDHLLPADAQAAWWQPQACWTAFEAGRLEWQRDLVICLDVYLDAARPMHAVWETVRAWAHRALVTERRLAVTQILHVPGRAGSSNGPHIHLLATARRVAAWGWADFAETTDDGLKALAVDLAEYVRAGR